MDQRLKEVHANLKNITSGCRDDMHEPDEQDLKCRIVGDHLDNACGAHVSATAIVEGHQEYVICLERFQGTPIRLFVNLADLIALARLATNGSC